MGQVYCDPMPVDDTRWNPLDLRRFIEKLAHRIGHNLKLLFWNLQRKPLFRLVAQLAAERNIDFIVLAEPSRIEAASLLHELANVTGSTFVYHASDLQPRLRFFSRYPFSAVLPIADSGPVSVRQITEPGCQPVIMVAVHSPSQLYWNQPSDRFALAARIRSVLEEAETRYGHNRSFVVGDFNSDPFDEALTNSDALHAVMARSVAKKVSRIVGGERRLFLYNPMWSRLGDVGERSPGTYYYHQPVSSCRFWHMFDQVLIRPQLVPVFCEPDLEIVTSIGTTTIRKKTGEPDTDVGSDHFPLVCKFDLIGGFPNV